jgi:hypothetical protein
VRKTGIGAVGDVPWGTHFFLFYETKEDLLDTLVPYFKAGLESGEFCVWVISEPPTETEAKNALRQSVAGFDRYLNNHKIEFPSGRDFYLTGEDLDLRRVGQSWNEKLAFALANRHAGLRLSAVDDTPHNKDVIQGWIAKWYPLALGAAETFASAFHGKLQPPLRGVVQQVNEHYRDYLGSMNLQIP